MAYITDKPEGYEQRAAALDADADDLRSVAEDKPLSAERSLLLLQASDKRRAAVRLRERATELRKRRTDGIKFG